MNHTSGQASSPAELQRCAQLIVDENEAATRLQAAVSGKQDRSMVTDRKHGAATSIQAGVVGFEARLHCREAHAEEDMFADALEDEAACVIQGTLRGAGGRNRKGKEGKGKERKGGERELGGGRYVVIES